MAGRRPWWQAHALFLLALAAGVAIRVTVMVAYRPVLLFSDSFDYLRHTIPFHLQWDRPGGYAAFLWVILRTTGSQYPVAVLQHLMGLVLAVACYAFLVRRGLPRWGATLAVLPILLDPLQLVLEHYLLSDVLFELLLVGAALVVLWRPRPGPWAVLVAGLLVAAATLTRGAGTLVLVAFVVALVCLRVGWRRVLLFLVAAAVPLAGYMVAFHHEFGRYSITSAAPRFLYARLAPIVRCDHVALPAHERALCPAGPLDQRKVINYYIWGHHQAPQWQVPPPAGMTQLQMVRDYDQRVVRSEPWLYARSVIGHFAMGFSPTRTVQIGGNPARLWLFENHYWVLDDMIARGLQPPSALAGTSSDHAAASFLADYRRWLWTPGPLLAALLLAALAAAFGVGRARRSGDRVATGLLLACCVLPLATGAGVAGFSWRYQLPQIALLPLAGALAVAALVRGRAPGRTVDPPWRVLARLTAALGRLLPGRRPVPAAQAPGRAAQGGTAVLVGAVAGTLIGLVVAGSGWALPTLAAGIGGVTGFLIGLGLIVSGVRSAADARVGGVGR